MGMFDSLHARDGQEFQTKAFHNDLAHYNIGDEMPAMDHFSYQVRVIGSVPDSGDMDLIHTFATVNKGRLISVHDERDNNLHLLDYYGAWIAKEEELTWI